MHKRMCQYAALMTFCFLLGAMAANCCHSSTSHTVRGKIVYNQVVAPDKQKPQYYRDLDLFYRDLSAEETIRLTDFARDPLLGSGISDPQWSPDGQQVLFLAERKATSSPKKASGVRVFPWIVNTKTKKAVIAGQQTGRWYLNAQWIPDGRSILAQIVYGQNPEFYSVVGDTNTFVKSGGICRLVVIELDTKKERVVWQKSQPSICVISPDGRYVLLYEHWGDMVTSLSLRTGRYSTICKMPNLDMAAFSPDGKKIALYSNSRLRICNQDGSGMHLLYQGLFTGMRGMSLLWSPNGKWVALKHFSTNISSVDPPVTNTASYIALVNVETGKAVGIPDTQISVEHESGNLIIVGWTKDGKYLILRDTGKNTKEPYPKDVRYELTAYPVGSGLTVPVTDITGYTYNIDWLPE